MTRFRAFLLVLCALWAPLAMGAEPYRIVVATTAGGPNDRLARTLAIPLAEALGQPVVVENRPGANGAIGAEFVVKSPPDGKTLLLTGSSLASGAIVGNVRFDPRKDLDAVIHLTRADYFLVAASALNLKSLADLKQLALSKPGGLNCAAVGGSIALLCDQLGILLGGQSVTILYPGVQPALLAVAAGQVDIMFSPKTGVLPFIAGGRVIPLAAASDEPPAPPFDKLPLLKSAWPELVAYNDAGIFIAAGTPEPVVRSLNATINAILTKPAVRAVIDELGFRPIGGTREHWSQWLIQGIDYHQALARRLAQQGREIKQ